MIFKTLLKYKILEYCIYIGFNKLNNNIKINEYPSIGNMYSKIEYFHVNYYNCKIIKFVYVKEYNAHMVAVSHDPVLFPSDTLSILNIRFMKFHK